MLRLVILTLAMGPLVYYLLSFYCIIEYFLSVRKLPPRNDSFAPAASILKPVRGVDRDAYENFASYCRLDYPQYELVFAMADRNDPVISVLEKLQAVKQAGFEGVEPMGGMNQDEVANAWRRYLAALARTRLVVLWVEDLHWAEAEVVQLLDRLTLGLDLPLLVIGPPNRPPHDRPSS